MNLRVIALLVILKRNINTPSDYVVKVSERAVKLRRMYEVAQ